MFRESLGHLLSSKRMPRHPSSYLLEGIIFGSGMPGNRLARNKYAQEIPFLPYRYNMRSPRTRPPDLAMEGTCPQDHLVSMMEGLLPRPSGSTLDAPAIRLPTMSA